MKRLITIATCLGALLGLVASLDVISPAQAQGAPAARGGTAVAQNAPVRVTISASV